MAFKMKGPGLPGYKKQNKQSFYRSAPKLNANRSPMLQTEEDAVVTGNFNEHGFTDDELVQMQNEYMKLPEETRKQLPFTQFYSEKVVHKQGEINRELSIAEIPGGGTGYSWPDKWETLPPEEKAKYDGDINKFIDAGEKWNEENPRLVALLEQTETMSEPDPDIEMTNHVISLSRKGIGSGTVHVDAGDGSFRFLASASNELNHLGTGELSAADIHAGVMSGKWKYDAKGTGDLIMSRDYYENTHLPMVEMYEYGQEKWNEHKTNIDDITSYRTKDAYIKNKIAENHPEVKEKSWFRNIVDGKADGTTKEYQKLVNDLNKQYRLENKDAYDDKACGYCSTKLDPANFGHIMPKILPTDEGYDGGKGFSQALVPSDYEYDKDQDKYVLKEGSITKQDVEWNNMSDVERMEHNAQHVATGDRHKQRQHKKYKEKEEYAPGATPYHMFKFDQNRYNEMTEEEQNSPEGVELRKDLDTAFAAREQDLNFLRQEGNVETDYEIDEEGNVIM